MVCSLMMRLVFRVVLVFMLSCCDWVLEVTNVEVINSMVVGRMYESRCALFYMFGLLVDRCWVNLNRWVTHVLIMMIEIRIIVLMGVCCVWCRLMVGVVFLIGVSIFA